MRTTSIIALLIASLLLMSGRAQAQPNFTRVTNTVLTVELISGAGAAWADYDGDGWLDLAQANFFGTNLLFHNNGDGTFTKITSNNVAVPGPQSYGVSWGDFDNDGRPDLFFANGYDSGAHNLLIQNLTNGLFSSVALGPASPGLRGHFMVGSWADYDRDGFLDLFVANSGGPSELWHNKGDGTFERVLTGALVTNVADSVGAIWADYDNDGWPDLFLVNGYDGSQPEQKNFLYHNNHDGTFTQIKTGAIVNDQGHFVGAAWGDYDNDGFLDLFVANNGGPNRLYHNDGGTNFTVVTQGPVAHDTGICITGAWADYDNDGWLDLFVANRAEGMPNLLYHNNGDGTFSKVTSGPIAVDIVPAGGCAWGDYDNDGFPDLFVSGLDPWNQPQTEAGYSRLYHNNGTTNNWLKVVLLPTKSNGSAIGAKVRVAAVINGRSVTQMREICSGDGHNGGVQEVIFGLGDASSVLGVSVEWPSGAVSTSPASAPLSDVQYIREPQPFGLLVLGVSPGANAQSRLVTVRFRGGDTTWWFSGIIPGGRKFLSHEYALETSTDLIHWDREASIGPFGPGPDGVQLDLETGDTCGDCQNHWFIRAVDLGFVPRFIPNPP
jgi:hypothetical protein